MAVPEALPPESCPSPLKVAAYPGIAAAIDMEVADKSLCQALKARGSLGRLCAC